MQIQKVGNVSSSFEWALIDATLPFNGDYEINGIGNLWGFFPWAVNLPLPTPFVELHRPSIGEHMFYMVSSISQNVPNDFTIYTVVRCYLQNNDETEDLYTTTNHDFIWDLGGEVFCLGGLCYRNFFRRFSCYHLTQDPPILIGD